MSVHFVTFGFLRLFNWRMQEASIWRQTFQKIKLCFAGSNFCLDQWNKNFFDLSMGKKSLLLFSFTTSIFQNFDTLKQEIAYLFIAICAYVLANCNDYLVSAKEAICDAHGRNVRDENTVKSPMIFPGETRYLPLGKGGGRLDERGSL